MLIRIVRMEFKQDSVEEFRRIFEKAEPKIKQFEGCKEVHLYRDSTKGNVFFTHSIWVNENHLEAYRNSDFFKNTWSKTKLLFSAKPLAYSLIDI